MKFIFKLFELSISGDDTINWNDSTIIIKPNIELLYCNLIYYPTADFANITNSNHVKVSSIGNKTIYTNISTNTSSQLTFANILYEWRKVKSSYLDTYKTTNLEIHYKLAPIYRNVDLFIVGVIILLSQKGMLTQKTDQQFSALQAISYTFISNISKGCVTECVTDCITGSSTLNILKGCINHQYNSICNQYVDIDYLELKIKIPLEIILKNMANYLPKLKIIKCTKNVALFYKVFSNSSKSIKLPTSLPATLSTLSNLSDLVLVSPVSHLLPNSEDSPTLPASSKLP